MEPVNAADLEWSETDADRMRFRRKKLAIAAGGEDLGCSLYELDPGDGAWPYHYHYANEEALFVLAGGGLLRVDDGEHRLAAGDYAAFPTGAEGGHRVVNDGDEILRYLVFSTMCDVDVMRYPDGEAVGAMGGGGPGATERDFGAWFEEADAQPYVEVTFGDGETDGGTDGETDED